MALTLGSLAGSVRPHSAELKLAEGFRSWGSFRFQELPNQSADEQSVNLILQPPPPTSTLTPQNPRGKRNPPDTYLTSHFLVFWGQSQHLAHPEKHSHLPKTTCSQLEQLVFCLSCLIVLHSNKSTSSGTSRWTLESHFAVTFMFAGGGGGSLHIFELLSHVKCERMNGTMAKVSEVDPAKIVTGLRWPSTVNPWGKAQ